MRENCSVLWKISVPPEQSPFIGCGGFDRRTLDVKIFFRATAWDIKSRKLRSSLHFTEDSGAELKSIEKMANLKGAFSATKLKIWDRIWENSHLSFWL